MINRLGHCASYHTTEELETELTFEANKGSRATPYGMHLSNEDAPMWVGWNAMSIPRDEHLHKIWYLPHINQSPTSNAVVVETMKRSLRVAVESGKQSIAVTYDLAIAKLAMQIQAEEKPTFDDGSFHIELALFSAFGKVIDESGGPHILNECEVLAKGSITGFTKGKNYKRCKRLHKLLALAMEILHFV